MSTMTFSGSRTVFRARGAVALIGLAAWLTACQGGTSQASPAVLAPDQVLYHYSNWDIRTGAFGPVAELLDAANRELEACGKAERAADNGQITRATRTAIRALSTCPAMDGQLPADSPARDGAITEGLWRALLPGVPVVTPEARAASVKLTFEATDYPVMQWNYCQNRPFYEPSVEDSKCYSNDKRSFITWGPNGATAGHGREVQVILLEFLKQGETASSALDAAFGAEARPVRRMLELANNTDDSPLEVFLCSVWMQPERRKAWRDGFAALGTRSDMRAIYQDLYRSASYDGGKIARFHEVWTRPEFGLAVTELDHAFFIDRAAHMSISQSALAEALTALKQTTGQAWPPAPAVVRQHIALSVRPTNQKKDRLGRDVAFYVAGVGPTGLNPEEAEAWRARGRRNAVDVGLSDERLIQPYSPGPARPVVTPTGQLRPEDGASCPAQVLAPLSPAP